MKVNMLGFVFGCACCSMVGVLLLISVLIPDYSLSANQMILYVYVPSIILLIAGAISLVMSITKNSGAPYIKT